MRYLLNTAIALSVFFTSVTITNAGTAQSSDSEALITDYNKDGIVDIADVNDFIENWKNQQPDTNLTTSDSNLGDKGYGHPDNDVNISDLNYYMEIWQRTQGYMSPSLRPNAMTTCSEITFNSPVFSQFDPNDRPQYQDIDTHITIHFKNPVQCGTFIDGSPFVVTTEKNPLIVTAIDPDYVSDTYLHVKSNGSTEQRPFNMNGYSKNPNLDQNSYVRMADFTHNWQEPESLPMSFSANKIDTLVVSRSFRHNNLATASDGQSYIQPSCREREGLTTGQRDDMGCTLMKGFLTVVPRNLLPSNPSLFLPPSHFTGDKYMFADSDIDYDALPQLDFTNMEHDISDAEAIASIGLYVDDGMVDFLSRQHRSRDAFRYGENNRNAGTYGAGKSIAITNALLHAMGTNDQAVKKEIIHRFIKYGVSLGQALKLGYYAEANGGHSGTEGAVILITAKLLGRTPENSPRRELVDFMANIGETHKVRPDRDESHPLGSFTNRFVSNGDPEKMVFMEDAYLYRGATNEVLWGTICFISNNDVMGAYNSRDGYNLVIENNATRGTRTCRDSEGMVPGSYYKINQGTPEEDTLPMPSLSAQFAAVQTGEEVDMKFGAYQTISSNIIMNSVVLLRLMDLQSEWNNDLPFEYINHYWMRDEVRNSRFWNNWQNRLAVEVFDHYL